MFVGCSDISVSVVMHEQNTGIIRREKTDGLWVARGDQYPDWHYAIEWDTWSRDLNMDLALGDGLLVTMKFSKNADPDKYKYSGYGIGFHAQELV